MSELETMPSETIGGSGGVPARRAMVRWAWRLFRREWRQQLQVVALLAVTTAAAVAATTTGYNVVSQRSAQFGTAQERLELDGSDPAVLQRSLTAAAERFDPIEVIGHRSARIPGSDTVVDLRAQAPDGVFGAGMLAIDDGRAPKAAGEVALTDGLAEALDTRVGDTVELANTSMLVVGIVENPADLSDEFALTSPAAASARESVTVLLSADEVAFEDFVGTLDDGVVLAADHRGQTESATAAAGVLGAVTLVMLLVAFVAAAGFVVIAQRRLRQLGMVAAIGASRRHLRLVTVANGAIVGLVASIVGVPVGLGMWLVAAPRLEQTADHRLDVGNVPTWAIAACALLGIVTATVAAWWPARVVSRVSIMTALGARRPTQPTPVRRSAVLAAVLLVGGMAALVVGVDPAKDEASIPMLLGGTIALAGGILAACPITLRVFAVLAKRMPIAIRLALRDLARYQARSAAALAAVSLALGIPVAAAIITSAGDTTANRGASNLSDRQLMIRVGEGLDPQTVVVLSDDARRRAQTAVDRIGETLGAPQVFALSMAVDPSAGPVPLFGGTDLEGWDAVGLRVRGGDPFLLYVATPELLEHYGLAPALLAGDAEVFAPQTDDLVFREANGDEVPVQRAQRIDVPDSESAPRAFVSPTALRRLGWKAELTGWFVEGKQAFTPKPLADARDIAAESGISIETEHDNSRPAIGLAAAAVGAIVALAVLALTVGLIRAEAAQDLRTLTATGATSGIRRAINASTAGGLALLGVLLGVVGAYAALVASYSGDLGALRDVPVAALAALAVGVPIVATVTGWLLAGRWPVQLGRPLAE